MENRPVIKMMTNQNMTITNSIEQFYMNRNNYNFDLDMQRGLVWSQKKKSELILSILIGMYIPPLVINNLDNKEKRFMDGKQRSNSILGWFSNEYPLSDDISDIEIKYMDGEIKRYDLRGKYFRDLDIRLSNHFKTRLIEIRQFDDLTPEQESFVIRLLNNGEHMKGIDFARLQVFDTIHPFVEKNKRSDLFNRKLKMIMTKKEKYRLDEKLLYSLIAYECNVDINDNIENMVRNISEGNKFTEGIQYIMENVFLYMNEAYPTQTKHLNTSNFIPIYVAAKKYMGTLTPREFYGLMCDIFDNISDEYENINGHWNGKSALNRRIEVLSRICEEKLNSEKIG